MIFREDMNVHDSYISLRIRNWSEISGEGNLWCEMASMMSPSLKQISTLIRRLSLISRPMHYHTSPLPLPLPLTPFPNSPKPPLSPPKPSRNMSKSIFLIEKDTCCWKTYIVSFKALISSTDRDFMPKPTISQVKTCQALNYFWNFIWPEAFYETFNFRSYLLNILWNS